MSKTLSDVNTEGRNAYTRGDSVDSNPYPRSSESYRAWDNGFWWEHDDSFVPSDDGFEDGYGNFLDYDAVSQGFYDDDPDPYSGTYSEM